MAMFLHQSQLRVVLTPGNSIDTQVLVRAEFVTAFRNRCVLEEKYRIVARN